MTDLFHTKANEWDKQSVPQQISQTVGRALIENIKLNNSMEVMDFGAGTGLLTSHVVPLVKSVAAVDISRSMLDQLVAKPEFNHKVTAYCTDIIHECLDKKFDLVISAMALHHVKDTASLLKRFYEHLKTGGSIALADLDTEDGSFHPYATEGVFHHGFDRKLLSDLLTEAGFVDIKFSTAHVLEKEGKKFPIFLVSAQKK